MPFEPGKSGNPGGRSKAKPYQEALLKVLKRDEDDEMPAGKTYLDKLARKHVVQALDGDVALIRDIADRLDGKPAQAIVGGDDDDNPINIIARIERVIIDPQNSNSPSLPAPVTAEPV